MKNSIFLYALLVSACVTSPNIPIFRELGPVYTQTEHYITLKPNPVCMKEINETQCGRYTYTVTGESGLVGDDAAHHFNGKSWSEIKRSSLLLSVDSYPKVKDFISLLCKKNKECRDSMIEATVKVNE